MHDRNHSSLRYKINVLPPINQSSELKVSADCFLVSAKWDWFASLSQCSCDPTVELRCCSCLSSRGYLIVSNHRVIHWCDWSWWVIGVLRAVALVFGIGAIVLSTVGQFMGSNGKVLNVILTCVLLMCTAIFPVATPGSSLSTIFCAYGALTFSALKTRTMYVWI